MALPPTLAICPYVLLTGAVVTVVGLLFAVWARRHLGSNWSQAVTVKQGHELITTGPYALVRHPIYTGILTGFLGTAIALSQVRGIIGLS
ncbi:MAG TPA: isoprenylcysteine carboxylmethyltransferase family protein [Edaphobacter sp.]|nr:isoprenylcysteine carboxylmethyltransferase family protein [Edaphobacter sp.]